jgi:radical SAM superfamily enzyme YgiQ (UPF0313 family)
MFPKIVIFAAGAHIDYFLERVYTSSNEDIFDFCIYADGEPAIDMIPKYIKNEVTLKDIPNIVYKENGQVIRNKCERIKKLSYDYGMNFDKDVYPAVYSNCEKVKLIPVENARGCNFRCEFCIHPIKSGNYREKSINELMEELDVLNKKYGFINFYACGSNTSHKFCIDILKKVYEKGNDYILSFFQSARDFNIENRDILSKANVGFFWIGIETASQDIAKNQIKNHKKISDSELVCKLLNEIGIRHYDSYIFPMPGYNFMSADETIELINRINSEWVVIYPPLLQPRTAWVEKGNEYIKFINKEQFINESMFGIEEIENKIFPPAVTNKKLIETVTINERNYQEVYYQNVRFRYRYDKNNILAAHNYNPKKLDLSILKNKFYYQHDKMSECVNKALRTGDFDEARKELSRYNEMCTSGTIKSTRVDYVIFTKNVVDYY